MQENEKNFCSEPINSRILTRKVMENNQLKFVAVVVIMAQMNAKNHLLSWKPADWQAISRNCVYRRKKQKNNQLHLC